MWELPESGYCIPMIPFSMQEWLWDSVELRVIPSLDCIRQKAAISTRPCAQGTYSAVTAACMMSKRSLFDKVGGFSEDLAVAFNDIDYCMKIRSLNKLVVYVPYALFYHYESKSRGLEDTPEKVERFNREIRKFSEKWPDILRDGDPYI